MSPPLYLAFAPGAIGYDCGPCGACCQGLGFSEDPARASSESLVQLAPFVSGRQGPMVSFFTYSDGCRHQGDDNLCDLHRHQGPEAKPRICRLFPFSKLVDVDGLWILLPHHLCPWVAATPHTASLSDHRPILEELLGPNEILRDQLEPDSLEVRTPLDPQRRLALETDIRQYCTTRELGSEKPQTAPTPSEASASELPPPEMPPLSALFTRLEDVQRAHGIEVQTLPHDEALWIDLLRSLGDPPALPPDLAQTFAVAIPALRILLCEHFRLEQVPLALRAYEIWLRTGAELGRRPQGGRDLCALLEGALPLVRVLVWAEDTIPPLPEISASPALEELWASLRLAPGAPLGETALLLLRSEESGALTSLMALGRALGELERPH